RMRAESAPPAMSTRWTASPSRVVPNVSTSPIGRYALETEPADADIFGVEIVLDALMSALAPEPRFLDTAERRFRRGNQPFVDADHAVFQPFHHAEGAAEVAGVEVTGKAVFGVVG